MPIRTIPFDKIDVTHIEALVERRAREDRTLEFKESLELGDSGRVDFLADVTAMANGSGGTIIYGIVEGDGEDRGVAVGLKPMTFAADEREKAIANLLRDGVDQRISGVLHRAIRHVDGYFYVVRVPASRSAPHMITLKTQRPRFYLRGAVSSDPMDVQQIKEVVMRSQGAEERALALIEERTRYWLKRYPTITITKPGGATVQRAPAQVLLHIVPLFPPAGGIDLANEEVLKTFESVPPFYSGAPSGSHRMSLDGYMNFEWFEQQSRIDRSVQLLRRGALEFQILDVAVDRPGGLIVDVGQLETSVIDALRQASALADAGLVMPPVLISLRLLKMGGAALHTDRLALQRHQLPDNDALLDPLLVNDWGTELDLTARRLFDVLWQAYGFRRCFHYNDSGTRLG